MVGETRTQCIWISPSEVAPRSNGGTSAQRFADTLAAHARVEVTGLQIWESGSDDAFGLPVEVAGIERLGDALGWSEFHLFGFSAGATVALAVARALPQRIRTLAIFEPASIGDDVWSPVEAQWRADLRVVRGLPLDERQPAFRQLLMAVGHEVPTEILAAPQAWDELTDKLEDMLDPVGFRSDELAEVDHPTLIMSGARSHPRFHALGERLAEVMPQARHLAFPTCHHLAPPHRVAQQALRSELHAWWTAR